MILIVGDSHDDVLYFKSVVLNRKEEKILNRYDVVIGTLFNQEVMVLSDMYTSILASAVLSSILDKYYIDLIIVVLKS